jgi:hypothetical protein
MHLTAPSSIAGPLPQADAPFPMAGAEPAERHWAPQAPWMYRSEAFAEDLIEERDPAVFEAPVRVSTLLLALTLGVALAGAVFAVIEPLVA